MKREEGVRWSEPEKERGGGRILKVKECGRDRDNNATLRNILPSKKDKEAGDNTKYSENRD